MASPGGGAKGSRTPLIADVPMPVDAFSDDLDLHNFVEDDFDDSNPFDFSNSPNMLQSLETIGSGGQKAFISPQELSKAGSFIESPNDSYQDSSSDSSSKRAGSSSSSPPKALVPGGDITMDDGKPMWDRDVDAFDGNMFGFGRDGQDLSGMYGFGDLDGDLMDHSFDFESPATSPEDQLVATHAVVSPNNVKPAPSVNGLSKARKPKPTKKVKQTTHQKRPSRNGMKADPGREASPMSFQGHSQEPSPTSFVTSPSLSNGPSYANGNNLVWPNQQAFAPAGPNGLLTHAQLGPVGQPTALPQQMPLQGPPPPYNFPGQYQLKILPTPAKSRVETQVPIKIQLTPLPPGVTKLHLPTHTISKPKLQARPPRSPDMLELYVSLYCTSAMQQPHLKMRALERAAQHPHEFLADLDEEENAPQNGGEVRICAGCITRERKRTARKKNWKPEDEKIWLQHEDHRVIVFNTSEVKEWQPITDDNGRPGQPSVLVEAPMRIACYCRHQAEKMGFNVVFTVKDHQDRIIAQTMSNPIMITDDHKTHPMAQLSAPPAVPDSMTGALPPPLNHTTTDSFSMPQLGMPQPTIPQPPIAHPGAEAMMMPLHNGQVPFQGSTVRQVTPGGTMTATPTRSLSRQASPSQDGPLAKKRKASGSRVPDGLAMTRLDTSPVALPPNGIQMPASTPPFTPNPNAPQLDQMMGQPPFATGPPTPSSNDQGPFFSNNRNPSMDNRLDNMATQLYSAPASNHPSRAPSPNSLRNSVVGAPPNQITQALMNTLYAQQRGVGQLHAPPVVHKIIPNEGPISGGIEVTILGAAFFQGLEVWFGDCKATTTTFWGESSLVCLLPPSHVEGTVPVTLKQPTTTPTQGYHMGQQGPVFKYVDDSEPNLIRTALAVLGHKMSGKMMDVNELARRILSEGHSGWAPGSSAMGPASGGQGFNTASHEHLESQLLKCLDLIDLDDSAHRTRLDLTLTAGRHTMLHLACSLGYHRFVAALLARGANPDARDKGGFTPLHMAAIHHQPEIVRRLMLARADPGIRSLSGLTAADVAQSRHVVRAIRDSEGPVRTRSGGSLHSKANSATSLRSLWEPMTKVRTSEGLISPADSGTESPEYSSGDFEDDVSDDEDFLNMRRPSDFRREESQLNLLRQASNKLETGMPSPTAAARGVAIKDQFQQQFHQFQQAVALQLQGLPHLPNMPQMPNFGSLNMIPTEYQAYLQEHPLMQRVQQFMPSISGLRPDSQDGDQSKMDHRWWDLMSYMNNSAAPPPAYADIYPEKEEQKQASAIQAAADAEADLKCAQLYDEATESSVDVGSETESKNGSPSVLKIGRKNAITKEQQEQFLRAHERNLKTFRNDWNLFFVWIPLLLVLICAATIHCFPSLFVLVFQAIGNIIRTGWARAPARLREHAPNLLQGVL